MLKRFLLAAIVLLGMVGVAQAETCTFGSGATSWTGTTTTTGVGWTGCTPDVTDSWVVPSGAVVTVTGNLVGIVGSLTVQSGGIIKFNPLVSVEVRGGTVFESGSCPADACTFGNTLASTRVPHVVTHSGNTIVLDFTEAKSANVPGLPWTICAAGCTSADVQVGTLMWVNWQEFDSTDAGIVQPVDAEGMFLEVTAVDNALDTVTLSLPKIPANVTTNNYTVAESVSAGRMQSLVGGTSWTVASTTVAENNEGKIRYETLINAADTPFDASAEFSGFLACKAGTERCARILYTEPNYSATSEMFTTLKNPANLWAAGDELDIYYARLFPGDKITPVNPTKFTNTANGSVAWTIKVQEGSELFTIENIFFDAAWATHTAGQGNGILWVQNGTTSDVNTIRQIYFGNCDGPDFVANGTATAVSCLTIENTDNGTSGPDGDILQNVHVSDLFIAYPMVVMDYATNPTQDGFISFGIWLLEESTQRISNENTWNHVAGAYVANWENVTFRRIRMEGTTTGITTAPAGRIINCDDDLLMQDFLVLHSRSSKPRDNNHFGEDQIEMYPHSATCGIDRMTVMRSQNGTGIGPLRWARPDQGIGWGGTVWGTNLAEFGGPSQEGNTNDAAGRGIVNYTWPTPTYGISPEGHTSGVPDANGMGWWIANYMTDGLPAGSLSYSYGSVVGWWTARQSSMNTLACGNRQVGMFRIGGSAGPASTLNPFVGCESPHTDIQFLDNYLTNQGGQTNNGPAATCDATGTASGVYQCDGSANVNNGGIYVTGSAVLPMPSLVYDRNLSGWGAHDAAFKNYAWFTSSTKAVPSITMTNSSFYGDMANLIRVFYDNVTGAGLLGVQAATIGPNVWAVAGTVEWCDTDTDTPVDRLVCNFASPVGDLSPDSSPHGGVNVKFAGDLANGRGIRVLGAASVDGTDDPTDAQPYHAGPVVWDVFAWVTPEMSDMTVFERGTPRSSYLPGRVRSRYAGGSGGRGGSFAPTPFGGN